MLYECNFPRLLMFKFGPLLVALLILIGLVPQLIMQSEGSVVNMLVGLILPTSIGIALLILFAKTYHKFKYVAIGKMKVIVRKKGVEFEYHWTDVDQIDLHRFLGLYKLKIRNEEPIYFTPYGVVGWITGDDSDMGVIIQKMKNELDI